MNEEITLGQLLQTMTTSTKVRIFKDLETIYIGTALHAFDTSTPETLDSIVMSIKATGVGIQQIRL